jgi:pimeloyl-ACP methyl ester carboxylesterase
MKEFFSNQLNLFYKKNEHRSGRPTLVLVHGLTGSSSAWLRYEKLYEDKYNLLSYDIRGHGRSFKPKNYPDYAIKEFGAELHDLLAAENISDFILVSHSFGTMIALEFLEHWPDMAKGAIFLSPNYDYNKNNFSTFTRIILKLGYIFRLLPYSGKPRGQVDYDRFPNSSDWDIRRMVADMKNTGLLWSSDSIQP